MRIGMVLGDRDRLPDIRVDKEAAALLDAGHQVALLVGRLAADSPSSAGTAVVRGVQLHRADVLPLSVKALSPRPKPRLTWRALTAAPRSRALLWRGLGLEGLAFWPQARSQPWIKVISAFIAQHRPDVLHVHDLLLLPSALAAAAHAGIEVVADLHENWPAYLAVEAQSRAGARGRAFAAVWHVERWRRSQSVWLSRCRAVLVVAPEAAAPLVARGLPRDRIVVVSNTEPEAPRCDPLPEWAGKQVLLFAGSLGPERDLGVALAGLAQCQQQLPALYLVVVGASPSAQAALLAEARALGVAERLVLRDWVTPAELARYYASATLGLLPLVPSEHTHTMMPHKLFQYFAHGLPALVSDCAPVARVVRDTGAGVVYPAHDAAAFAAALCELLGDPQRCAALGAAGRAAVAGPYHWRHDAARLCAVYHEGR